MIRIPKNINDIPQPVPYHETISSKTNPPVSRTPAASLRIGLNTGIRRAIARGAPQRTRPVSILIPKKIPAPTTSSQTIRPGAVSSAVCHSTSKVFISQATTARQKAITPTKTSSTPLVSLFLLILLILFHCTKFTQ